MRVLAPEVYRLAPGIHDGMASSVALTLTLSGAAVRFPLTRMDFEGELL